MPTCPRCHEDLPARPLVFCLECGHRLLTTSTLKNRLQERREEREMQVRRDAAGATLYLLKKELDNAPGLVRNVECAKMLDRVHTVIDKKIKLLESL